MRKVFVLSGNGAGNSRCLPRNYRREVGARRPSAEGNAACLLVARLRSSSEGPLACLCLPSGFVFLNDVPCIGSPLVVGHNDGERSALALCPFCFLIMFSPPGCCARYMVFCRSSKKYSWLFRLLTKLFWLGTKGITGSQWRDVDPSKGSVEPSQR